MTTKPEERHYPTTCLSAFCGRTICTGCEHLPKLTEFKEWAERTNAQPIDPIWTPNIYQAQEEIKTMTTTTAEPQAPPRETWEERQAREELERIAAQEQLEKLGEEIAKHLPGKWYSEAKHDFRPTLLMHDLSGMRFLLYISTQNRLTAHAPHLKTPRGFTPQNQPATITMSHTRTAKSLAADIDRRLIGDLIRYFDKYRIMYHEEVTESTRHQNLMQALADAGEGTTQHEMDDRFRSIARGDIGTAVWTAKESYQKERINLEFHQISTAHAQQILQFVAYLQNQRENEPCSS